MEICCNNMTVRMSITILVLVVMVIAGNRQLLDGSFFYQKPTFQVSNTSHVPFYLCEFKVKVDCLWKVDGKATSLSLHNYTWMIGNGTNTNDCSIQGRSHKAQKLNKNKHTAPVICSGISFNAIKKVVRLGDSIQLNCSFSERRNCSWKRNEHVINISGRYEYIQQHNGSNAYDCSIRIQAIQLLDLTTWICLVTATDDKDEKHAKNAFYNLQLYDTEDLTSTKSTAATDSSTIKRLKNVFTISDKASLPSTMDPPTPSDGLMANSPPIQFFLGFVGILLLIAITIGLVQLIRKFVKKKNTEHDKSGHDEENRVRLPLETIAPSSPSTANQPQAYYNVTTTTTQSQAEDANGYLVPLKLTQNANSNETKAKISKRSKNINDPKNHIYEKVDDRTRIRPQRIAT